MGNAIDPDRWWCGTEDPQDQEFDLKSQLLCDKWHNEIYHFNGNHGAKSPSDWIEVCKKAGIQIPALVLDAAIGITSPTPKEKPLEDRERANLLNIIGALAELIQTPKPGRDSDSAVISELVANYSDKPGISERNLQKKFAAAKRSLLSS